MEIELLENKREELVRQGRRIGMHIRDIDRALMINNAKRFKPVEGAADVSLTDLQKVNMIIEVVENVFGIDQATFLTNSRKRPLVQARHCAIYVAMKSCSSSLQTLCAMFSTYRTKVLEHATLIHAKKQVENAFFMKQKTGNDADGFATKCERVVVEYLRLKDETR